MVRIKHTAYRRTAIFLGSKQCFRLILLLFVVEAAWIALSGRYPMAFDEDFHLGIIKLYAHHLSPFWSVQPPDANAFGAVYRDPSYLYHYLMSFPYRLLNIFTDSQTAQVLWLRAINIGLFAGGLILYRRLLLRTGASRTLVNLVLLLFVLIPVVPLLAAQINYDNLFIPLIGLILLLTLKFNDALSSKRRIDAGLLAKILILCLLTSLVKYAFLPLFVTVIIYIGMRLWQIFGTWSKIRLASVAAVRAVNTTAAILLTVGLLLAGGLFLERYGINIVRYHTPVPDCGQILSVEECSAYPPWRRDYNNELRKETGATKNPGVFAADWFYGMWLRLFFAVDGPATQFQTRGPLFVPGVASIAFAVGGVLAALMYGGRLLKLYNAPVLGLMLLAAGLYIASLWVDGYQTFLRTGQAVAINGRYLFPVLPFLLLICALAVNEALKKRERLKYFTAGVAVICMLWGGGALTYALRSNPAWYWPNAPLTGANQFLQRNVGRFIPGYDDPTAFMGRN